ncbi:tigger transposable element-derived protein 4 [Nephila pilipes]|uniref:Tigger transposable element-derived protein 4 n=1 Tax=Nephila pilipes TaxID=299642 RepID=A0A8X6MN23_NEPPI|nr:tigger transposable element-derived protein 4 [Nephila pilipes]
MVVINFELVFIGCLICREQYNSGRFIQDLQPLTPIVSSIETSSISPYTLSGIASRSRVLELVSSSFIALNGHTGNYVSCSSKCQNRLRTCVYEDVEEAVLKSIRTMRDKNVPISGPFVIEKALQFAKALGYDQFPGSNRWLEKFKKRHGIVAKAKMGKVKMLMIMILKIG